MKVSRHYHRVALKIMIKHINLLHYFIKLEFNSALHHLDQLEVLIRVRNLPNHAAMAAAYGLPKDIALRSVTLSAAEIIGIDKASRFP